MSETRSKSESPIAKLSSKLTPSNIIEIIKMLNEKNENMFLNPVRILSDLVYAKLEEEYIPDILHEDYRFTALILWTRQFIITIDLNNMIVYKIEPVIELTCGE